MFRERLRDEKNQTAAKCKQTCQNFKISNYILEGKLRKFEKVQKEMKVEKTYGSLTLDDQFIKS